MICRSRGIVFVHIPKTGGTTIERLLWTRDDHTHENLYGSTRNQRLLRPPWKLPANKYQLAALQHLTAAQVMAEIGEPHFRACFSFSIVRNPFDRLVSQFEYTRQERAELRRYLGITRESSFKTYLRRLKRRKHPQWQPQVEFLFDDDRAQLVDRIFRMEEMDAVVAELRSRYALTLDHTPHLNKTERKSFVEYYDDEARALVEELYRDDLRLLDYRFEP